jgi:hypothetical protein
MFGHWLLHHMSTSYLCLDMHVHCSGGGTELTTPSRKARCYSIMLEYLSGLGECTAQLLLLHLEFGLHYGHFATGWSSNGNHLCNIALHLLRTQTIPKELVDDLRGNSQDPRYNVEHSGAIMSKRKNAIMENISATAYLHRTSRFLRAPQPVD